MTQWSRYIRPKKIIASKVYTFNQTERIFFYKHIFLRNMFKKINKKPRLTIFYLNRENLFLHMFFLKTKFPLNVREEKRREIHCWSLMRFQDNSTTSSAYSDNKLSCPVGSSVRQRLHGWSRLIHQRYWKRWRNCFPFRTEKLIEWNKKNILCIFLSVVVSF